MYVAQRPWRPGRRAVAVYHGEVISRRVLDRTQFAVCSSAGPTATAAQVSQLLDVLGPL
jgi:hypothetical protein